MISQELYDECLKDALAEPKQGFESLPPGWLRRQLKKRGLYLKEQIDFLRREAEAIRENLGEKLQQITDLENSCLHLWSEPRLVVQRVNYDCGCYGGNYDSRKWERECTNCGKVDTTYREALRAVPNFD